MGNGNLVPAWGLCEDPVPEITSPGEAGLQWGEGERVPLCKGSVCVLVRHWPSVMSLPSSEMGSEGGNNQQSGVHNTRDAKESIQKECGSEKERARSEHTGAQTLMDGWQRRTSKFLDTRTPCYPSCKLLFHSLLKCQSTSLWTLASSCLDLLVSNV